MFCQFPLSFITASSPAYAIEVKDSRQNCNKAMLSNFVHKTDGASEGPEKLTDDTPGAGGISDHSFNSEWQIQKKNGWRHGVKKQNGFLVGCSIDWVKFSARYCFSLCV